ncbi:MAG: DegQ family serine endoprotease [Gammaproteobacteria bacterium]|nr:DegQ family serine endoprotease [Gammaproteobacteria bacterium]
MNAREVSMKSVKIIGACLIGLVMTTTAWAALPTRDSQGQPLPSLAPMLSRVMPAVVNISTRGHLTPQDNPLMRDPFFRYFFGGPQRPQQGQRVPQSLGSGVIIDAGRGYVVTNNHVVDKAAEITVTLQDGRNLTATLIGADPEVDLAVVQIQDAGLKALDLGDSDALRVGDFVTAIGNPFGLGQTATSGIVSALGRSGLGIEGYEDFIQTDASINPGNSGGALVDLDGHLVGINTAIVSPGGGGNVGIGFAIPINMARKVIDQLIEFGEVHRGRLGLAAQDLTPELAAAFDIKNAAKGAVVAKVAEGSAAAKAGIKVGDVIIAINGKKIASASDMRNALGLLRVDEQLTMLVSRDGHNETLVATIAAPKRTSIEGDRLSPRLAGAVFVTQDPSQSESQDMTGIEVADVAQGSPAWLVNLRKGDVITSINRRPVTTLEEMKQALKLSERGILLNINRGSSALFVLIQ